jgi:hypothetical protein
LKVVKTAYRSPNTVAFVERFIQTLQQEDAGQEWVKLKNHDRESVSVDGWMLRDESDNSLALSGSIAAGAELMVTLAEGQLPLNNGGDEIELLDADGNSVHVVSYSSGQAVPGQVINVEP